MVLLLVLLGLEGIWLDLDVRTKRKQHQRLPPTAAAPTNSYYYYQQQLPMTTTTPAPGATTVAIAGATDAERGRMNGGDLSWGEAD